MGDQPLGDHLRSDFGRLTPRLRAPACEAQRKTDFNVTSGGDENGARTKSPRAVEHRVAQISALGLGAQLGAKGRGRRERHILFDRHSKRAAPIKAAAKGLREVVRGAREDSDQAPPHMCSESGRLHFSCVRRS
jgi:hypothetical protein